METPSVSSRPKAHPLRALNIVLPEIRKALQTDDLELAMAYLPVVEWAVEVLSEGVDLET